MKIDLVKRLQEIRERPFKEADRVYIAQAAKEIERSNDFLEALQEISEARGTYRCDPIEHAKNCIREMQAIALNALNKYGITPRGKPLNR